MVQVWSIGQPTPNFTLEGHEKGVNSVDYYNGGKLMAASRFYPLPALLLGSSITEIRCDELSISSDEHKGKISVSDVLDMDTLAYLWSSYPACCFLVSQGTSLS